MVPGNSAPDGLPDQAVLVPPGIAGHAFAPCPAPRCAARKTVADGLQKNPSRIALRPWELNVRLRAPGEGERRP